MKCTTLTLMLLLTTPALAQQQQLYDAQGRNAGRVVTDSHGNRTMYGPDGRPVMRSSPSSSGTTTIYDAATGRRIGTTTDRSKQ